MKQGEREHGTEKETEYRKCRRRWGDHLPEEVQEVNSAAEWKTGLRKEETGLVIDCWGKAGSHSLLLWLQLCMCSWPSPGNQSAFTFHTAQ